MPTDGPGTFSRRKALQTLGAGLTGTLVAGNATAASERAGGVKPFIIGTKGARGARAARRRANSVTRELDFGDRGSAVVGQFPPEAIEALQQRADVRYAEFDGPVEPLAEDLPWGVDRVDAEVAHAGDQTGSGADIAIIDSGIDSDHPDLQANLGEGYAVVSCSGCRESWDDDHGHGTHCAGIADAVDNTTGVVGVSTQATLHAVKVFDADSYASVSGLAEGIQWVADQGYDVGSMSLGATSSYSTLRDACQYAHDRGVLLVAAAGNDGSCSDCVRYPAGYSTVVAVSATSSDDSLAYYSSTGPEVELAAPGSSIRSTIPDGYGYKSGTSMATPHVAGAAGLVMANGYTNTEARSRLQQTAEDIGLTDNEQGYGLLDAEAAVGDSGSTGDTSAAVTTDSVGSVGETTATFSGTVTDLGGASSADVAFEYRESGSSWWSTTATQTLSSTGSFSQDVTGLASGTDYEVRAVAEASDGDTDTGGTLTFTTSTADTNVAVSTDGTSNVGTSTATLAGTLTDLGQAASADVAFEYRQQGTSTWSTTTAQTLWSTGSFDQDVSGLASGTDYEVRAVAEASDGDTDTGGTLIFTTNTADTNVAVSTDAASNVDETSVTLNGSLDDLGGASQVDVYFEWGESGGTLSSTTGIQTLSATGSFAATLSDLASGTSYEFRAVAEASDGDTDAGASRTVTTADSTTGETAPSVDGYSVTEAGSPNPHAEITADWTVSDADGDLDSVLVEVVDAGGAVVDTAQTAVSGGRDSGTDRFKIKHARQATFSVRATVTDASGYSASQTETVTS